MKLLTLITTLLSTLFVAASYDSIALDKQRGSDGLIRLSDSTFEDAVSGPRDYTLLVLLTAEAPQYGCAFCRIIGPAFNQAAYSWAVDHPKSGDGIYFAIADIDTCRGTFQQLELTHAPNLWIYKPTDKPAPVKNGVGYDVYQFPQMETQLPQLLQYLNDQLGFEVKVHEPFKWDRFFLTIGTVITIGVVLKIAWKQVLNIFQKKQLWTAVTLVCILMFTAGHMFNMIRKVPYLMNDGHGGITYFIGGHQNQIGVETQIIALTYAVLAFCTISLIVKVPKVNNRSMQSGLVYFLVIVIFVTFSFLIAKFKVKNGGYPFSLWSIF